MKNNALLEGKRAGKSTAYIRQAINWFRVLELETVNGWGIKLARVRIHLSVKKATLEGEVLPTSLTQTEVSVIVTLALS